MSNWSYYPPGHMHPQANYHVHPQAPPPVPYPYGGPQNASQAVSMPTRQTSNQHNPQSAVSTTFMHSLAEHFDRAMAATQATLLERISSQDGLLMKQQESIDSISRIVSAGRDASGKEQETLRIEVLELREKIDHLTKGVGDAMKQLAVETIKVIGNGQTTTEQKLLCLEESLEGLKEEIRDPHADVDAPVHHEVAIGPNSPIRTPLYHDAGVVTVEPPPSQVLSGSTSCSRSPIPSYDGHLDPGHWNTQGSHGVDKNIDSIEHFNSYMSSGLSMEHANPALFKNTRAGSELQNSRLSIDQRSCDTVNPMDTLHVPHSPMDSFDDDSGYHMDVEARQDLFAAIPKRTHVPISRVSSHISHSPLPSFGTPSSSQRVADTLLPGPEATHEEESTSPRSSLAPEESAPGSNTVSTISLPDPLTLLEECFSKSKSKESKITVATSATPKIRKRLQRLDSMSSLSSLSSNDVPLLDKQLSVPVPSSRGKKIDGAVPSGSGSPLSVKKRRRSSPGPNRGGATKRPRTQIRSAPTKKMKKELLDGQSALYGKGSGKKSAARSASGSSWPEKSDIKEARSRQFIQCDKCQSWYHWGCVGIQDDDPRLQDDEDFICPPCQTKKQKAPQSRKEGQRENCSRPDCNIVDEAAVEEYFIEKIIGRHDHKKAGIGRFSWLIKWEGYPAEDSTWTPAIELENAAKLIDDFELAAKSQGVIMSRSPLTFLREAVEAGFADKKP